MQSYSLKVTPDEAGMRLDLFLAGFFKKKKIGLSRTSLQRLIQKGMVERENTKLLKPHYRVRVNEELKISVIEEEKPNMPGPEDIPLDIVYEDEDLAVINKQSGLVTHPAAGNYKHTLVNALLFHFKNLSDVNSHRPGIVHRLDKGTSGILVIAKNNFSQIELAKQFAAHSIKRKYIAIVKGKMEFDENMIELPIARHPIKRKNMSVSFKDKARYAKTHYRTLRRMREFSLLELEPFTGRTHQLRVHLAFLGHPILGDDKYGRQNEFGRLALHAKYIGFMHPGTGKFIEFSIPIPKEFSEFLCK